MAEDITQLTWQVALRPSFGRDMLDFYRMVGEEAVNRLFTLRAEALSTAARLDPATILGTQSRLSLKTPDEPDRYFNGICTEFRWLGTRRDRHRYEVVLRPWLWFGSLQTDNRIFKEETLQDILSAVLASIGGFRLRFDLDLDQPATALPYCVQCQETNLAFVTRLLEGYGRRYHFEHIEEDCVLVVTDSKLMHVAVLSCARVPFLALDPQYRAREPDRGPSGLADGRDTGRGERLFPRDRAREPDRSRGNRRAGGLRQS